jgi:hypothetical protein
LPLLAKVQQHLICNKEQAQYKLLKDKKVQNFMDVKNCRPLKFRKIKNMRTNAKNKNLPVCKDKE